MGAFAQFERELIRSASEGDRAGKEGRRVPWPKTFIDDGSSCGAAAAIWSRRKRIIPSNLEAGSEALLFIIVLPAKSELDLMNTLCLAHRAMVIRTLVLLEDWPEWYGSSGLRKLLNKWLSISYFSVLPPSGLPAGAWSLCNPKQQRAKRAFSDLRPMRDQCRPRSIELVTRKPGGQFAVTALNLGSLRCRASQDVEQVLASQEPCSHRWKARR